MAARVLWVAVLGALVVRDVCGLRSDLHGSHAGEPTCQLREDRQVRVELHPTDPTDAERE